jgi:VanZ family protein
MNHFVKTAPRLLPMLSVMGTIFALSHTPGQFLVLPDIVNIDKVAHLAIYGLLAVTVFFAFGKRFSQMHPRLVPILVLLFCTLYGISDEWHQSFIPNRTASVFDVLADGAGAAMICVFHAIRPPRKKKERFL